MASAYPTIDEIARLTSRGWARPGQVENLMTILSGARSMGDAAADEPSVVRAQEAYARRQERKIAGLPPRPKKPPKPPKPIPPLRLPARDVADDYAEVVARVAGVREPKVWLIACQDPFGAWVTFRVLGTFSEAGRRANELAAEGFRPDQMWSDPPTVRYRRHR